MKKLVTFLYVLVNVWILFGIIRVLKLSSEILVKLYDFSFKMDSTLIELILATSDIIVIGYLLFNFYKFSKTVNKLDEKSFFQKTNGISFHKMGKAIITYVIIKTPIKLANSHFIGDKSIIDSLPNHIASSLSLLIMSLFLLIISHLIKKGFALKQENDLTI